MSLLTSTEADLALWPDSARLTADGDVRVGGVPLTSAAERYGTPLYVLDEDQARARARAYRAAFPDAGVHYAAKAFLCRALVRWLDEEGIGLDVCSAGELELAVATGFPADRVLLHGNAKSPRDLASALRLGVGRIVLDSVGEITRLAALVPPGERQRVLVRVVPGISAGHHDKVRTGDEDQKFGLSLTDGSAQHAVARVLATPRLELTGLHCHIGSQIAEVKPYLAAQRRLLGLRARIAETYGVVLPEIDLGGGHAVAQRPGERGIDLTDLARRLRAELAESCRAAGLPEPRLLLEPGRALVARAGVAVYRVLAVKRTAHRVFVAVDGGMGDNPRPALYGAPCVPRLVGRVSTAAPHPVDLVGRHCEAGDVLAPAVPLPADIRPGDLVATPVAGAYQLSMASAYNLHGRPPLIAIREGTPRLLIRREEPDDLWLRDLGG
ncbi:diaminopimelate decarboxylase [Streptomyces sp. AM 3-1-1]|uniref:diaminopimelate decarboxylase n=1 Tax=Streptomyces sp. AM 3-1-1 TaxID=3028711 RepID=UPI0023B9F221|nr:diaminopimelate decarboxylase [Streptomyces sp. AM 3-1-1]WEH26145.1 diaminopimelate decarboxylase [Streptomyces sp. AM 3-1-1]